MLDNRTEQPLDEYISEGASRQAGTWKRDNPCGGYVMQNNEEKRVVTDNQKVIYTVIDGVVVSVSEYRDYDFR